MRRLILSIWVFLTVFDGFLLCAWSLVLQSLTPFLASSLSLSLFFILYYTPPPQSISAV